MDQQRRFDPMTGEPLTADPAAPKTAPQSAPEPPGKTEAITSLVLGIVALCFCLTSGVIALGIGITGIVFASQAKKKGYRDGLRTGGFVTSLLSIIFGSVSVLAGIIIRSVFFAFGSGLLEEILEEAFLI